jgi:hypothetical protein
MQVVLFLKLVLAFLSDRNILLIYPVNLYKKVRNARQAFALISGDLFKEIEESFFPV